jgi:surface protein
MRTATSPPISNLGDAWLPLLQAIIRNNQSEYSVTDDPGGASQKIEAFEQAIRALCPTGTEYVAVCRAFLGDALVLVLQDEVEALHAERLPALWRATAAKLENANRTMREFDKEDAETGEPDEWNVWNVASRRNGVPALKLMDAVAKGRMRLKHDENVADFEVRAAHRMDQRVLHLSYKTALALLPHVFGIDKWADRFMAVYPKVEQWDNANIDARPTEAMYGPYEAWDVSNVTNMGEMFSFAESFNRPIGAWDVSNVTNMHKMFTYAQSFNQPLQPWDLRKVTNVSYMFHNAKSFNQPLEPWDLRKVRDVSYMFHAAKSFNQPIEEWNVSSVTNMSFMFAYTQSFNQPIEEWKVNNVTDMGGMFMQAQSFNQPIGTWKVGNVTNMVSMFARAKSFDQPIEEWNVSSVTNMMFMFAHTESFNQPLHGWKVHSGVHTFQMFYGAHFPQDPSRFEIFNSEDVVMGNA